MKTKIVLCLLLLIAMTACGQKGPLVLPDTTQSEDSETN